ncbi:vWA domain-containing protein [Pseudoxanthomonas sp. UC19_8]|uniref:vWA domain-containing protein n=1 Tax=Pseudoxanthomonas sp. UC19_8 TaxID=3350175 RepID=UPI0036D32F59
MSLLAQWMHDVRLLFGGFAWPWMWLALPLPWLVTWLLPAVRSQSPALRVPYGDALDGIAVSAATARRFGINWLAALAWLLLCAAAARPQQLGEAVTPPQTGRDLMLAVDLSGSMRETDMELGGTPVDRLTAAKAVLADFLDRRVGDRVGLLVFGNRAYAVAPLTLDRDSVRDQLRDTVSGLAGRETAIGDAIGLAVKRLAAQPKGQRVLILLTDGVSNAGALDPDKAAELAAREGVRIHTIAFGGGGGLSVFGMRLGLQGQDDIDEDGLRRIAQATGGRFFRARDTQELAGIYSELDKIEPISRPGRAVQPRIERYPVPLAFALGLGVLALAWRGLRA